MSGINKIEKVLKVIVKSLPTPAANVEHKCEFDNVKEIILWKKGDNKSQEDIAVWKKVTI